MNKTTHYTPTSPYCQHSISKRHSNLNSPFLSFSGLEADVQDRLAEKSSKLHGIPFYVFFTSSE